MTDPQYIMFAPLLFDRFVSQYGRKQTLFDHIKDEHLIIYLQFTQYSDSSVEQVRVKICSPEAAEGLKIWRGANDGEGFTSNSNKIKEREGKWPLSFRRTCRMAMCFRGQELRCRGLGSNVKSYLPKGSFKRLTLHQCSRQSENVT